MLNYNGNTVRTSVRRLIEYVLRKGDIRTGSGMIQDPEVMLEGSRLHRKIQKKQKATYRSEVPLKMSWMQEDYELVLEGRADGIDRKPYLEIPFADTMEDNSSKDHLSDLALSDDSKDSSDENLSELLLNRSMVVIDEIKCVMHKVEELKEADVLHLGQAKCYAYMHGKAEGLEEIIVQITYCHLETEEIKQLAYYYKLEDLEEWFMDLIDAYKMWADYYVAARKERNGSIQQLHFPFDYRDGQKTMLAMVYKAIDTKNSILLQAPTGVGKTISTMYPALKSMGEGKIDHIFYLTAKTITRTVAEDTLTLLREQKLELKSVTITAKEKICVQEEMVCHPDHCDRAKGHFDRINTAIYDMLHAGVVFTREHILEYSEKHMVCPYELAFELAMWADMVICDYNYVFDPYVARKNMFGEQASQTLYLIDESHNLPERAREMYSMELYRDDFVEMKSVFRIRSSSIVKKLQNCIRAIDKIRKNEAYIDQDYNNIEVDGLYFPLLHLVPHLQDYLKDHDDFEGRDEAVEFFFRVFGFLELLDGMEEGYISYAYENSGSFCIRVFCVDPSARLSEYLAKSRSTIFFSATILPVPYFKQLLGGEDHLDAYSIPSSFSKENRLIAITSDVTSRYTRRGQQEYTKMVIYLENLIQTKTGNYMIFFPSYEMLNAVLNLAEDSALSMFADFLVQNPDMSEKAREEFLNSFQEDGKQKRSMIAFCVLGSIFSEGIDLTGKRLIGAVVVGTGLPMVCKEREQIRSYFDIHGKKGYDYAYRYPGINKVLQAAGRVIRTAEDVGVILLMDERFLYQENQVLLPAEWDYYYQVNVHNVKDVLEEFWSRHQEDATCIMEN